MKVWCFKADGDLWALTDAPDGARLPAELGSWRLHREVELTGDAEDEREAIKLISAHGFCCFEGAL